MRVTSSFCSAFIRAFLERCAKSETPILSHRAAGGDFPCRQGAAARGGSVYARRMKLYNYVRSSASFRVRIALELKGLAYDYVPVHLVKGEHRQDSYAAISS